MLYSDFTNELNKSNSEHDENSDQTSSNYI